MEITSTAGSLPSEDVAVPPEGDNWPLHFPRVRAISSSDRRLGRQSRCGCVAALSKINAGKPCLQHRFTRMIATGAGVERQLALRRRQQSYGPRTTSTGAEAWRIAELRSAGGGADSALLRRGKAQREVISLGPATILTPPAGFRKAANHFHPKRGIALAARRSMLRGLDMRHSRALAGRSGGSAPFSKSDAATSQKPGTRPGAR